MRQLNDGKWSCKGVRRREGSGKADGRKRSRGGLHVLERGCLGRTRVLAPFWHQYSPVPGSNVAQLVECLPSMHCALGLISVIRILKSPVVGFSTDAVSQIRPN